jgi:hypothetical protein
VELLKSSKRPHINEKIALRKVVTGNKLKQLRNFIGLAYCVIA